MGIIYSKLSLNLLANIRKHKVITGFNTDIDYNGVTYHVQTEDKGLETPLILSLVYNRGTILASKRSPYNDLLLGKFDEKEIAERLHRQHKLICAAIRAGRIEDLKRMNSKAGSVKRQEAVPKSDPRVQPSKNTEAKPQIQVKTEVKIEPATEETPIPSILREELKDFEPIKKPQVELPKPERKIEAPKIDLKQEIIPKSDFIDAPIEITDADLIFDDTHNLDDIIIVPDEAVEIVTAFSRTEEINDNGLFIDLLHEVTFRGGESRTVSILVGRGAERNALVGVNLMIKVLSSSFRPLIFHTKTDSNGVAIVHLQIPSFSRGRAAVLVKAMINGEEAELRRIIHPG